MATHKHALALARRRLWRCARRVRGVRCMLCAHASAAAVSRVRDIHFHYASGSHRRLHGGGVARALDRSTFSRLLPSRCCRMSWRDTTRPFLPTGRCQPAAYHRQDLTPPRPPHKPIAYLSFPKADSDTPNPLPLTRRCIRPWSGASAVLHPAKACAVPQRPHGALQAAVRLCRPPSQVRKTGGREGHRGLCK